MHRPGWSPPLLQPLREVRVTPGELRAPARLPASLQAQPRRAPLTVPRARPQAWTLGLPTRAPSPRAPEPKPRAGRPTACTTQVALHTSLKWNHTRGLHVGCFDPAGGVGAHACVATPGLPASRRPHNTSRHGHARVISSLVSAAPFEWFPPLGSTSTAPGSVCVHALG